MRNKGGKMRKKERRRNKRKGIKEKEGRLRRLQRWEVEKIS